ncbi:MAG TPA: HNH endonuclease [Flavobacterium sp.]|nr:HNH endonuclease [Flavobacterium sp.]
MKNLQQHNYNIYPSLLDRFANYINSSQIYQDYYGFAEEPSISEEEFEKQQFQSLIDGINRVPFESEAADKGTMFNEVIDCIIENRKSDKMNIEVNKAAPAIQVSWKNWIHSFNTWDCKTIADALKGAVCQNLIEGFLQTKYGAVKLYGYYDYLLPFCLVDLKTTKSYSAFKFIKNWQHIVYPFILNTNGISINDFTYLVYKWNKEGGEIFEENYTFDAQNDIPKLTDFVEQFIEFMEINKHLITDLKVFNKQQ